MTTPTGERTDLTYDNLGRATRATHYADSSYVSTAYNEEDQVVSATDENLKTTTTAFDDLGRVSSVTDAKSQVTSFGYSELGVRTSLTNARNKTTTWTVDLHSRVTQIQYPDSTTEGFTYNSEGALASKTDGRTNVIQYSYDTVGRLTGIDYPSGTDTSISYRANDWRQSLTDRTGTYSWTYNARGDTTQLAAPQGTLSTTWDAAGNRLTVARSGGPTTTTTFDDASRPITIANSFSETTNLTLNGSGQITQQVNANGTKVLCSYSSGRSWLTDIEHRKSDNTLLARYEYTRDYTGRITQIDQPSVYSLALTYDNIYELTREQRTGTNAYDISYTYDAAGNRLTKVQGGVTESYTYGDNNQLLTAGGKSYQYDNDGNLTQVTQNSQNTVLAWDYNDKLTQITYPNSSTNTFATNDLGKRVSKTDSSGTTTYLFDGDDVLADSRADYTRGGVSGTISERAGSTSKFYHADELASTRGITNSAEVPTDSREYDSFGLTVANTSVTSTPFGFVGGRGYQTDVDSGLMLLGARYYDPSVGRWISRDPIGDRGGANLYRYSENDPANRVDPTGATSQPPDPTIWQRIAAAMRRMAEWFLEEPPGVAEARERAREKARVEEERQRRPYRDMSVQDINQQYISDDQNQKIREYLGRGADGAREAYESGRKPPAGLTRAALAGYREIAQRAMEEAIKKEQMNVIEVQHWRLLLVERALKEMKGRR